MRFSYSLTRVIISWPIVSIWRLLVHPSLRPSPHHLSHVSCLLLFHWSLTLDFHFPSFFLPSSASSLLPLYYSLSVSQYLVHSPLTPCNFLLNLIILIFFLSLNSHTPFHPLRLALSVLESHISAMREIKFLLLPLWLCWILLDAEPGLISRLNIHKGAGAYSALVRIWLWSLLLPHLVSLLSSIFFSSTKRL